MSIRSQLALLVAKIPNVLNSLERKEKRSTGRIFNEINTPALPLSVDKKLHLAIYCMS